MPQVIKFVNAPDVGDAIKVAKLMDKLRCEKAFTEVCNSGHVAEYCTQHACPRQLRSQERTFPCVCCKHKVHPCIATYRAHKANPDHAHRENLTTFIGKGQGPVAVRPHREEAVNVKVVCGHSRTLAVPVRITAKEEASLHGTGLHA
eukprot:1150539-Pelagomonas_calceolata.AAC.4